MKQIPTKKGMNFADGKSSTDGCRRMFRLSENCFPEAKGALPAGFFDSEEIDVPAHDSGIKQGKEALPEGFFDNKDADLRARGIEPVKIDVKDEYKAFEKLIQEDLAEVDNRFEEEEAIYLQFAGPESSLAEFYSRQCSYADQIMDAIPRHFHNEEVQAYHRGLSSGLDLAASVRVSNGRGNRLVVWSGKAAI